jgi:hypothetical protein
MRPTSAIWLFARGVTSVLAASVVLADLAVRLDGSDLVVWTSGAVGVAIGLFALRLSELRSREVVDSDSETRVRAEAV